MASRLPKTGLFARIDIQPLIPKTRIVDDALRKRLAASRQSVDQLAKLLGKLSASLKELEGQDKLGNFEIQDLMSQYNQAEQLASGVIKKKDDTSNAIIGKI